MCARTHAHAQEAKKQSICLKLPKMTSDDRGFCVAHFLIFCLLFHVRLSELTMTQASRPNRVGNLVEVGSQSVAEVHLLWTNKRGRICPCHVGCQALLSTASDNLSGWWRTVSSTDKIYQNFRAMHNPKGQNKADFIAGSISSPLGETGFPIFLPTVYVALGELPFILENNGRSRVPIQGLFLGCLVLAMSPSLYLCNTNPWSNQPYYLQVAQSPPSSPPRNQPRGQPEELITHFMWQSSCKLCIWLFLLPGILGLGKSWWSKLVSCAYFITSSEIMKCILKIF